MLVVIGDNFSGALGAGLADDVVSVVSLSSQHIDTLLVDDAAVGVLLQFGRLLIWGSCDDYCDLPSAGVLAAAIGGARCARDSA